MMSRLWLVVPVCVGCLETNVPDELLSSSGSAPSESALALEGEWSDMTGELISETAGCNLSLLTVEAGGGRLLAGLDAEYPELSSLWLSQGEDGWQRLADREASEPFSCRPEAAVFDPDNSDTFWFSCIYGGPGIYVTRDGGGSFSSLPERSHNDLVSIDFSGPERLNLLVGGHEASRALWLSRDGGTSWSDVGKSLPRESGDSAFPQILSHDTFLVGVREYNGFGGVFKTVDSGKTWELVWDESVQKRPTLARDGSIYWANFYGPPIASFDGGTSWEQFPDPGITRFLPFRPILLPGGMVAASTELGILGYYEAETEWRVLTPPLPERTGAVVYSEVHQMFVASACLETDDGEYSTVLSYGWPPRGEETL